MSELLKVLSAEEALRLRPEDFLEGEISQEEFVHLFNLFNAIWYFPGDPSAKFHHAITKAGKHTNGFIDCLQVLKYSNLCQIIGWQMLMKLRKVYDGPIDWVVSAAYAGVDISHEVARLNGPGTVHAFVEKDEKGAPTVWGRHVVPAGAHVLVVNELMTTPTGSTLEAKEAINNKNKVQPVTFVPLTLLMVNRSRDAECLGDGTPVIAQARFHMDEFDPENCPYCDKGSPAVKPKVNNNWADFFKPAMC